jgi:2-polyprenyl-6-methoxyphenol hydroxylase-like FAD-dependent oxidoreductase
VHRELTDALEEIGADMRNVGVRIEKRIVIDRAGRIIGERLLFHYVTSWDLLQNLLRSEVDNAHYHLGRAIASAEQEGKQIRVHFADSDVQLVELLVGGDGIRSSVRAQFAPLVQPVYAGYFLWRGGADESELSEAAKGIFPHVTFFVRDHEQVMAYPMAGPNNDLRPGYRRHNFGWYRVGDAQTLATMCIDENGQRHQFSVPPPLVRKQLTAEMRDDAARLLPTPLADCLKAIKQPFFAPIYDFCSPTYVLGRVALVGDAASTPRPHVAFGVAKAACDARALADALAVHEDIDTALAKYNLLRQPIGEQTVMHGRKLGTQFGIDLKTNEERQMSQLMQTSDGVLDWIAMPNFMPSHL